MILFAHGAAGGWDELIIAAVAFAVLWLAVKLAGRKPAEADDEQDGASNELDATQVERDAAADRARAEVDTARTEPAPPPAATPR
jgi:hypothetical protein